MKPSCLLLLVAVSVLQNCLFEQAVTLRAADQSIIGDWSLILPGNEAGWLSVREVKGKFSADILWGVGSAKPIADFHFENGNVVFTRKIKRPHSPKDEPAVMNRLTASVVGDEINFTMQPEHGVETVRFTGKRMPSMPDVPRWSDSSFGEPLMLFNGRDLTGWHVSNTDKINGWSVRDGTLCNDSPKTDFGAYGEYANLRTDADFTDFQVHVEYRLPAGKGGNSGIYLRGLYEVQVTHRDSSMQGISGPGAIFGRVAPTHNAGKPAGEWESLDITLVNRHITIILNGQRVIDNQPVLGPTGGALHSDVTAAGPIYLQGDHTAVQYRNFILRPLVASEESVNAATPQVVKLWPGKIPGPVSKVSGDEADMTKAEDKLIAGRRIIKLGNVSSPEMHVYLPAKDKSNRGAVLVCPGGGFSILAWDLEGTEVAEWLNSIGYAAIIVKYRVPTRSHGDSLNDAGTASMIATGPLMDAQRAMSLTRAHANEWSIDPKRIGIMGFSAGGHVAVLTSLNGDARAYSKIDASDEQACGPNFVMPIYPAGFIDADTGALKSHIRVDKNAPPMFFVMAQDDHVNSLNCTALYTALTRSKVPAELHLFPIGGHGYGLRATDLPVTHWPDLAAKWLQELP